MTVLSKESPKKAPPPIVFTELGIVMVVSEVLPRKASLPIDVTELPIVTKVSALLWKAP